MLIVGLWFIIAWNSFNIVAAILTGTMQAKKSSAQGCATIAVNLVFSTICIVVSAFAIGAIHS